MIALQAIVCVFYNKKYKLYIDVIKKNDYTQTKMGVLIHTSFYKIVALT